jgi:hypothetical protein
MVVVFKACVEHGVLLSLGHAIELAFVVVSETDVFHCSSPVGRASSPALGAGLFIYSRRDGRKIDSPAVGVVAVFVGPAGGLDYAIQRDVFHDLDLSHAVSFNEGFYGWT